jgi:large-conductance mechanosensitive channel
MGRNEIRLRRQKMSAGRIAQHRNYSDIMQRHERDIRIRRVVKTFIYFLIIAFLLILFVIVRRWEEKKVNVESTSALVNSEKTLFTK